MVDKTSSPNTEDESKLYTNLLSSVGLDWMFCDREPDQPQETRTLRSRSESLKSSTKAVAASDLTRESRLCSAETAVTDPTARTRRAEFSWTYWNAFSKLEEEMTLVLLLILPPNL